ncbi:MAG: hypothetical protein ACXW0R_11375 [Gaiellaceae bacterium]
MSLRAGPVEQTARLPDGRAVIVRVGLFDNGYVAQREVDTVTLDLVIDDEVEATVETVLSPDETSEALLLAREIASKLESGELEPTAGAIEHLALTIPE